MSERLERQSDQHAIDGVTEPGPGAVVIRRGRRAVGAQPGAGRNRVAGGHRCGELRRRRGPVAEVAPGRRRLTDGGSSGDRLEIHCGWLRRRLGPGNRINRCVVFVAMTTMTS